MLKVYRVFMNVLFVKNEFHLEFDVSAETIDGAIAIALTRTIQDGLLSYMADIRINGIIEIENS